MLIKKSVFSRNHTFLICFHILVDMIDHLSLSLFIHYFLYRRYCIELFNLIYHVFRIVPISYVPLFPLISLSLSLSLSLSFVVSSDSLSLTCSSFSVSPTSHSPPQNCYNTVEYSLIDCIEDRCTSLRGNQLFLPRNSNNSRLGVFSRCQQDSFREGESIEDVRIERTNERFGYICLLIFLKKKTTIVDLCLEK